MAGPVFVGAKLNLISQSRGDAMSLAPRATLKLPTGSQRASIEGYIDLVASREIGERVELTGVAGGALRGDPDDFRVSDGVTWGVGATFPSRSRLRGIVE